MSLLQSYIANEFFLKPAPQQVPISGRCSDATGVAPGFNSLVTNTMHEILSKILGKEKRK